MAALTSKEIAYAPVINNESVTDTKRGTMNRLQLVLCIVLVINVVIQFIAIVTPGWSIVTSDTVSAYQSVYYATACVKYMSINNESVSECKTLSFHDSFRQDYNDARDERKPALVRAYNFVVQYQLNIQIAWFLVVGTIIFQVFKLTRPNEGFPRLTIINVVAVTCPLMLQILFKNFVEIDFNRRISEFITRDVGFPYSFFFYVFTSYMTVASLFLIVKQVVDHIREKDRIYAEMKVKFDRLQLEYEAEVDAFKRFRRNTRLRPDSGGSYRGDRRSKGDDRGSHSPRLSQEIRDGTHYAGPHDKSREHSPRLDRPDDYSRPRDHSSRHKDRDNLQRHSPRPRDRSPPGEHSYRDHSPRHSSRPLDRSPPREHRYRDHSPRHSPRPRDRSPPREHSYRGHSPRHSPRPRNRSPPGEIRGNQSPRNRSPPREDHGKHASRRPSPPLEDRGNNSIQNSGEHDNPALVITPATEIHSSDTPGIGLTLLVDANRDGELEENDAKTKEFELTITKI